MWYTPKSVWHGVTLCENVSSPLDFRWPDNRERGWRNLSKRWFERVIPLAGPVHGRLERDRSWRPAAALVPAPRLKLGWYSAPTHLQTLGPGQLESWHGEPAF